MRLFLVDDHTLVRGGLRSLFSSQPDFEVVAEAGTVEEALEHLKVCPVDLVLLDLLMPGIGGVEGASTLLEAHPGLRLVVVSCRVLPTDVRRLILCGVSGFCAKDSPVDELLRVVRRAGQGQLALCPTFASVMAEVVQRPQEGAEELTARQLEVLRALQKGATTREIADRLLLSPRTIEKHRREILRILGARNTPHALRIAADRGIL